MRASRSPPAVAGPIARPLSYAAAEKAPAAPSMQTFTSHSNKARVTLCFEVRQGAKRSAFRSNVEMLCNSPVLDIPSIRPLGGHLSQPQSDRDSQKQYQYRQESFSDGLSGRERDRLTAPALQSVPSPLPATSIPSFECTAGG